MLSSVNLKHVFISYVHEDSKAIDRLCETLTAAQIPYWRDRQNLAPGDTWKSKIREAIQDGSLVFIGCFSKASLARETTQMNEELTIAVEEFRKRAPGQTWLIPIRLDQIQLPVWDLGAGRTLSDLHYVDLFGAQFTVGAVSLVTTVQRILGEKQLSAADVLETVEQATDVDRAAAMKKHTKERVVDPTRRIELDDLVNREVNRVTRLLNDPERLSGPVGKSREEQIVNLAERAETLWESTRPFCESLAVAARWGDAENLAVWANGIRAFVQSSLKIESGNQALLSQRHLPGVLSLMTAALAAGSTRKWMNLKALTVDPTVRDSSDASPRSLLEATDPRRIFGEELVPNTLARGATSKIAHSDALSEIDARRFGKYHTPTAEWLHAILHPIFNDQWPDDESYSVEFDRAEVLLGVLGADASNARAEASAQPIWGRSHWFGRSPWRAAHHHGNPVHEMQLALGSEGSRWGPLHAGLFGGSVERATKALEQYQATFDDLQHQSWF